MGGTHEELAQSFFVVGGGRRRGGRVHAHADTALSAIQSGDGRHLRRRQRGKDPGRRIRKPDQSQAAVGIGQVWRFRQWNDAIVKAKRHNTGMQ